MQNQNYSRKARMENEAFHLPSTGAYLRQGGNLSFSKCPVFPDMIDKKVIILVGYFPDILNFSSVSSAVSDFSHKIRCWRRLWRTVYLASRCLLLL